MQSRRDLLTLSIAVTSLSGCSSVYTQTETPEDDFPDVIGKADFQGEELEVFEIQINSTRLITSSGVGGEYEISGTIIGENLQEGLTYSFTELTTEWLTNDDRKRTQQHDETWTLSAYDGTNQDYTNFNLQDNPPFTRDLDIIYVRALEENLRITE